jgi:hypothetical protein
MRPDADGRSGALGQVLGPRRGEGEPYLPLRPRPKFFAVPIRTQSPPVRKSGTNIRMAGPNPYPVCAANRMAQGSLIAPLPLGLALLSP